MRAMLPAKSAFFNKLSLDNNYYYLIKDEIVTVSNDTVLLSSNTRLVIITAIYECARIIIYVIVRRFLHYLKEYILIKSSYFPSSSQ